MLKFLKATKDAYITDRVINGERVHASNTGKASSLDLFKLYGMTFSGSSPNTELSRLLIKFDLTSLRETVDAGLIDTNSRSFSCRLKLFDVDGGQTVPSNFSVVVNPLSRSFDEGLGRDIVLYADSDTCNFLTGSRAQGPWLLSGANYGGLATDTVDYVDTAVIDGLTASMEASQTFVTGIEDLDVDVTAIVSATLSNAVPDEGFRIAFTQAIETDTSTYFVKRFAARTAFDDSFHPRLEVRFDDSIQDDTLNIELDNDSTMFLYNFNQGSLANLKTGSVDVTGSNSLQLKLSTAVSGGFYDLLFSGSQHAVAGNENLPVEGVYSASVLIPSSDPIVSGKMSISGSVDFVPVWGSPDGTFSYHTGSVIKVIRSLRGGDAHVPFSTTVNMSNVQAEYEHDQVVPLKVNIFDRNSPKLFLVKVPTEFPGLVVRDVHYQVRCVDTGEKIIPFDTTTNSTRVSSDTSGMYFNLDCSNLHVNRTYTVDICIVKNGARHVYKDVSSIFRVTNS